VSITFKPLVWGPVCEPNDECRYNHCEAQTPFGRFLLTWKGWKDDPGFVVEESPWHDWLGSWDTLKDAKEACEKLWRERLMMCIQEAAA
jgi:hypothetical protein